ncbi:hypothetical protein [Massilia luteola]|jgi:hypothetical protein|uniref:hypothetical protein n=1 Tax=Massilia luteola TaxID=3081751 RepID=UPI002ACBEB8B|nr:hypothetical protein [Massilia sp. Gc5]
MKKNLATKWWIELPCCVCAVLIVQGWLQAAGVDDSALHGGFSFARLAVWACCFYVVERIIKFALWAIVLAIAPGKAGDMP